MRVIKNFNGSSFNVSPQSKLSATTLHKNALRCTEMRWNFARNALKPTEISKHKADWDRCVAISQSTAPLINEILPILFDFIFIKSLGKNALKLCRNSAHFLHILLHFSAYQLTFVAKVNGEYRSVNDSIFRNRCQKTLNSINIIYKGADNWIHFSQSSFQHFSIILCKSFLLKIWKISAF